MSIRVTVSFVSAAVLGAAALAVGLAPYSESGFAICPSALTRMTGGTTFMQSLADTFASGACTKYAASMTMYMVILAVLALGALILGLVLRGLMRSAASYPVPVPVQPDLAPVSTVQRPSFAEQPLLRGSAGWVDSPEHAGWLRWWDGSRFTDNWRPKL